jgi:hypothetical protein
MSNHENIICKECHHKNFFLKLSDCPNCGADYDKSEDSIPDDKLKAENTALKAKLEVAMEALEHVALWESGAELDDEFEATVKHALEKMK